MISTRICPRCNHVFDSTEEPRREIPVQPEELLKSMIASTRRYRQHNDEQSKKEDLRDEKVNRRPVAR